MTNHDNTHTNTMSIQWLVIIPKSSNVDVNVHVDVDVGVEAGYHKSPKF